MPPTKPGLFVTVGQAAGTLAILLVLFVIFLGAFMLGLEAVVDVVRGVTS